MRNYQMLIGGKWVEAAEGDVFESINPYLGKPWAFGSRPFFELLPVDQCLP